jgi:hypothetical protein
LSKVEEARLKNIMTSQHNWNEVVVRQFFSTMEVNFDMETTKWMTRRESSSLPS